MFSLLLYYVNICLRTDAITVTFATSHAVTFFFCTCRYKSKQGAKAAVFAGKIMKTKGGKGKETLMKNKAGRVVSKKLSAKGKASKWMKAVVAARCSY